METTGARAVVAAPPLRPPMVTGPVTRTCTKCHHEPRDQGQRWGKRCRTAWRREARRLARMRRLTDSTRGSPTARHSSHRRGRGGGVRLAALEAAAAVLVNELTPAASGVVVEFAEGARVDLWIALLGTIERYAELVPSSAPCST